MFEKEVYVFFSSIIVGAILAIIFDFFRLIRRKGNTSNIVVYLQDILYWFIVAIIIIASAFITNDGALRGYMFVGYILGAIIYIVSLSKLLLNTLGWILDFIENIFKSIFKFIAKCFKKIGDITKKATGGFKEKIKIKTSSKKKT